MKIVHPSKFFDEAKILDKDIRIIGADEDIVNVLKNIHPMNWIGSDVNFQIVKISISYDTNKGNRRVSEKYSIQNLDMNSEDDPEMQAEIQAGADISKFLTIHLNCDMKNYKIEEAKIVALATLRID